MIYILYFFYYYISRIWVAAALNLKKMYSKRFKILMSAKFFLMNRSKHPLKYQKNTKMRVKI
jgi:hypothetical protein